MIDDGKAEASPAGHPETLAIHAGQQPDPGHGAVMEPIVMSSTFAQPEPGQPLRFDYSRSGHPTRAALEACQAALEHGRFGCAFGSGCAAGAVLMHTLRPGDQVVCGDDVYGGTYRLFNGVMRPLGSETITVDMRTPEAVAAALTDRTRLVWLETPTNPLLHLADIGAIASVARARGVPVVVDNTFASPMLQDPLDLGATAVVHSATQAESRGGVESLAEHPAIMTHASIPAEFRRGLGISDTLVRLSVGLEHVEDLWRDLQAGLAAAARVTEAGARCRRRAAPACWA